MAKGFLHLHLLIIVLFVLLYLVKVILLLAGKTEALDKLRAKTKIADMILGTLILVTGGYLTAVLPEIPTYLIVKIVLVIASIPLGIIAMKKSNKAMAVAALLIYIYVFGMAETKSVTFQKEKIVVPATQSDAVVSGGKAIYDAAKCAMCHGEDGKLMLNGAKDLSVSTLSTTEAADQIRNGKGLMPAYKDQLTEEQILAVSNYVLSLKK